MAHRSTGSRRSSDSTRTSSRGLRRAPLSALLAAAVLLLCAPLAPAMGGASSQSGAPSLSLLERTALAAIGNAGAARAMDTLGNSLALLGARYQVEEAEAQADAEAEAAPAASSPAP